MLYLILVIAVAVALVRVWTLGRQAEALELTPARGLVRSIRER